MQNIFQFAQQDVQYIARTKLNRKLTAAEMDTICVDLQMLLRPIAYEMICTMIDEIQRNTQGESECNQ